MTIEQAKIFKNKFFQEHSMMKSSLKTHKIKPNP
jgi:hypothetical protein